MKWTFSTLILRPVRSCRCLSNLFMVSYCILLVLCLVPDNWVLRWVNDHDDGDEDSHGRLQVCLIDFGKAKDLRPTARQQKTINDTRKKSGAIESTPEKTFQRVAYTGVAGAKTFSCPEMQEDSGTAIALTTRDRTCAQMNSDHKGNSAVSFYPNSSTADQMETPLWNYQADYYGLCACIHQLLFLQPMTVTEEPLQVSTRRGFQCSGSEFYAQRERVRVPLCSLKRYARTHYYHCMETVVSSFYCVSMHLSMHYSSLYLLDYLFDDSSPWP
jgi:hypothetical protein